MPYAATHVAEFSRFGFDLFGFSREAGGFVAVGTGGSSASFRPCKRATQREVENPALLADRRCCAKRFRRIPGA